MGLIAILFQLISLGFLILWTPSLSKNKKVSKIILISPFVTALTAFVFLIAGGFVFASIIWVIYLSSFLMDFNTQSNYKL